MIIHFTPNSMHTWLEILCHIIKISASLSGMQKQNHNLLLWLVVHLRQSVANQPV